MSRSFFGSAILIFFSCGLIGQKNGLIKAWYSNGKSAYVNSFKNGKRHGISKEYSKTGNGLLLCDREFVNGKKIRQKCYNYE